jgi:hypothetical protein
MRSAVHRMIRLARNLFIAIVVIVVTPFVLVNLFGFGMLGIALGTIGGFHEEPKPANPRPEWRIVNLGTSSSVAKGYAALAARGDLHPSRAIMVSSILSFEEIRGDDPQAVAPDQFDSYVSAASSRLARGECDRVLATFARTCIVRSASAQRLSSPNRGQPLYTVTMSLMFVEKAEFGTVRTELPQSYLETSQRLNRSGMATTRIDRRGQASLRQQFYAEAQRTCQAIRAQNGNCSIRFINVNGRYSVDSGMVELSGSGWFSQLQAQQPAPQTADAR